MMTNLEKLSKKELIKKIEKLDKTNKWRRGSLKAQGRELRELKRQVKALEKNIPQRSLDAEEKKELYEICYRVASGIIDYESVKRARNVLNKWSEIDGFKKAVRGTTNVFGVKAERIKASQGVQSV